jgi:asparagine synthase (glutamine-hydrolysing)
MCGIVGIVGRGPIDRSSLERAVERIRHRGPDDGGVEWSRNGEWQVGLGNRRLSILDLSPSGHQPFKRDSHLIVYNGEVYNFRELREELERTGRRFVSSTDTEVVLQAYEEWGEACLARFNGMFAFAVWDGRKLFLARDRLGVKPLYYCPVGDGLAFASEIKSLLCLPGVPRRLDPAALAKYLAFLWVPDPHTLFEDVLRLPPGHCASFEDGRWSARAYWDVPLVESPPRLDENECAEELLARLRRSVQRRLVSDVPVGVFLSGGLDSTLITYLMEDGGAGPIPACSVGFAPEDLKFDIIPDDLKYARQVRRLMSDRLDYSEIVLRPRVLDLLPKVVWHMDEPVADPAAISTFLICEASRAKAKVMLMGAGAEELFAGYPRHLAMSLVSTYNSLPGPLRQALEFLIERAPASKPGRFMATFRNMKKLSRAARGEDAARQYLRMRAYYTTDELEELLRDPDTADGIYEEHLAFFRRAAGVDPIQQLLYVDMKTFLPCLNLAYMDKSSMAASVEVREPFLDPELVEFVAGIPSEMKIRGFKQKLILKRAAERLLPEEIVWRKKAGFGGPVRAWVMRDLQGTIERFLSPAQVECRGLLRYDTVQRIIDDQMSGREDNALRIWALLVLEMWLRTFIDADGSGPLQS